MRSAEVEGGKHLLCTTALGLHVVSLESHLPLLAFISVISKNFSDIAYSSFIVIS